MDHLSNIIKAAAQGDESAQRTLYEKYRTQWYMISMRYGKNKTQAEDIFQEGMIQIFKSLNQYDSRKSQFSTWSTRILINAGLKFLKKYNWIDTITDYENSKETVEQSDTIYQKLAAQELTMIIQRLPLGYRLVFNMYIIEGYSHKEIADQLGITVGTSKSQLSKARRELRKVLETQLSSSHE